MKTWIRTWYKTNRVMLVNSISLVGTTAVTMALGFVYWWVAARQFTPEMVGLGSAAISAMTLLGTICMLGLGTMLISEMPRFPGKEYSLITAALSVVGIFGGMVGSVFIMLAPLVSHNFMPLRTSPLDVIWFAAGVGLTSITLVFDQSLVGLLRGELQLLRNSLFAGTKLVVLFMVGLWVTQKTGMSIYLTWAAGNLISLVIVMAYKLPKISRSRQSLWPRWRLLRSLHMTALQHHMLNLTLQAPSLILPILVTALLSTKANAWFYVAWMLAGLGSLLPTVLAMVLFATNAGRADALAQKTRMTISIATIASLTMLAVLWLGTGPILNVFGHAYAEQAAWCLRILVLGAFPRIIKDHYVAICRIRGQVQRAILPMVVGGLLEIVLAAIGAYQNGLVGLSIGWLIALCIEALFGFSTVYKAVMYSDNPVGVQVTTAGR